MKKSLLFATALLAMGSQAKADEGMWTLYNLPEAVYQQMRAEGFELSQDRLYGAPDALKKAYADCAEPAHALGYAQESFFGVSELFNR